MKLAKSLFLGSVAGLAAVAGAQAADLPVAKAAPVEYVRVCSTYGAGFFYIPGTETCLRVGGRVRGEFLYVEPNDRANDAIGFRARGRIQLDARTATAYGLLRTFVRFEMTRDTGSYGFSSTSPNVDQAFVQFGGLTAGRTISFFMNSDLPNENWGTLRFYDAPTVNVFAYTFSFGNGFSATIAAEEGSFTGNTFAGTSVFTDAGQTMPDLVGNLKYAGTWGSAQLGAALHQLRSDNLITFPGGADYPDTKLGWAVTAQGYVNLPALAEGDALWLAATYADGALGYLGFDPNVTSGATTRDVVDAYIGTNGDINTGRGWSIAGGINHYWTPTIRQSVFGSYARVDYSNGGVAGFGPGSLVSASVFDFTEWRAGTNLIWSPVSGLDLGVEVLYSNIDPRGPNFGVDSDNWEGRLRVQRDF
ncbi:porin [Microvirga lotononidis]|uniref:Porin n=1 Tax=Microvirga lotononidis TaxID=864069 RepID=I4YNU9_9HYPH|nr:porin [Microvirga lotononidis]EIM25641.1 phosphate-selective porin [Microvirga lotononidis]WQO26475.1 porin [Microvirga lotononidis]